MKVWKSFFPRADEIDALGTIEAGSYFIDRHKRPKWETVYFRDRSGQWIALTWNYFDIEFKFEMYGISIQAMERAPATLLEVGSLVEFEKIDFYTKTVWIRPAVAGEVPSHFEQVIEEAGRLVQVPADATSVGTSLYAVVFRSIDADSNLMISIDDDARFSLKSATGSRKIAAVLQSCDVFDSVELLAWVAPTSVQT